MTACTLAAKNSDSASKWVWSYVGPRGQRVWTAVLPFICVFVVAMGGGCASYSVPGQGVAMEAIGVSAKGDGDPAIAQSMAKQPMAKFPTGIAAVRIQSAGYHSDTVQTFGTGRFCVVTTRDVEKDEQIEQLMKMPLVSGVAPVNRLLLPEQLNSEMDLRQAAACLHADVLLVYTLDTAFQVQDKASPLTTITLGLSPTQKASVICTASAVLLDTHNGYVYGVAEATDRSSQIASAWTTDAAVDEARRRTESGAFAKLVGELEKTWGGVVRAHAAGQPTADVQ